MHRLITLLLAATLGAAAHAADLTVSAAASLTNAFKDLAPLFEAANPGTKVLYNFGASGALLQQIDKGAPVDVFVSADQETMDQAQGKGLVQAAQRRNSCPTRWSSSCRARPPNTPKVGGRSGAGRLPAHRASACRPACRWAATPRACSKRPASGRRSSPR